MVFLEARIVFPTAGFRLAVGNIGFCVGFCNVSHNRVWPTTRVAHTEDRIFYLI